MDLVRHHLIFTVPLQRVHLGASRSSAATINTLSLLHDEIEIHPQSYSSKAVLYAIKTVINHLCYVRVLSRSVIYNRLLHHLKLAT